MDNLFSIVVIKNNGEVSGCSFDSVAEALSYFANVHHMIENSVGGEAASNVSEYYLKAHNHIAVVHFQKCAIFYDERDYLVFYDYPLEETIEYAKEKREGKEGFTVFDLENNACKKFAEGED